MGIEIKTDSEIDLNVLKDENNEIIKNHDAVIIAVGACVSKKLGIEGEDLPIVTHAVEYLKNPNKAENVVVVGGGNVAIDCALTAAHLSDGNGTVTLCYRRTLEDMKAYPEELELAESMKVKFEFRMTPKQILGKGAMFTRDEEEVIMMADTVVIAIGQTATTEGLVKAENFETETPKVYALGDAVTGTNTIIKAVAQAKELAAKLLD
jgi:dihydropyrimidine dehydrogenase (NAD+) subunit PreT